MYQFDIGPFPTVIVTTAESMSAAFKHPAFQGRPYNLLNSFELMMKGRGLDHALPGFAGSQGKSDEKINLQLEFQPIFREKS